MLRLFCLLTILALARLAIATASDSGIPSKLNSKHWAFVPLKKTAPPSDPTTSSTHPIDLFVSAKLREKSLKPVELADKRTLARRLYFDLIGLPPRPDELQAFLDDTSAQAWPRLVDKLLASSHYGERWGRHWMDVVRYADTAGDNADYPIPEVHLYRDYIIDSFNADKPYDQFVREQLAGDILAQQSPRERYAEQVVATGFLALSRRYGTGPGELWHLVLEDTIETAGRSFLGLTLRCARCHDHKYDPITTQDYYALYGIFASTRFPWAGSEEVASKQFNRMQFAPLVPSAEALPRFEAHEQKVKQLRTEIERTEKEDTIVVALQNVNAQIEQLSNEKRRLENEKQDTRSLQSQLSELGKQRDETKRKLDAKLKTLRTELRNLQKPGLPSDLPGAYAVQEGQPSDARVQLRGDPSNQGAVVERNVPQFLANGQKLNIPKGSSGRLQFADWMIQHPLTARVVVNRIWQYHFGKGIVATPSNFGLRGDPPTHPELLDWLAARFIESGWSFKTMHRLIVSSKTYQLSSRENAADLEKDPGNQLYWRHDRRRLEAEAIRDSMMMAAGTLNLAGPREHAFPPIKDWGWTQHHPFKEIYPSNHRSIYLMTQRFQRHPYLALFDGPDTNTSTDVRRDSTVPLQALYMMNNDFVREQAVAFAKRLIATSSDFRQRIRLASELAWSRQPNENELDKAGLYLGQFREELAREGVTQEDHELETWTSYARIIFGANEFVYVD
ncbi:MAG: DUF1553 domain-containing protein [Verrucomicrobia bacterium]|nr:DUF1553 domain-containing protein [Verrucomicrobiota bacterium]